MAHCKLGSKGCFRDGICGFRGDCENKIITNEDRIREMSTEEMSCIISCPYGMDKGSCTKTANCGDCKIDWLRMSENV